MREKDCVRAEILYPAQVTDGVEDEIVPVPIFLSYDRR